MDVQVTDELRTELQALIDEAYSISREVGREVEELAHDGLENPLSETEAERLLLTVVETLRDRAAALGDAATLSTLEGDAKQVARRLMWRRAQRRSARPPRPVRPRVQLMERNGVPVEAVKPVPWFHGTKIPMMGGHVKTTDIQLWHGNDRLEIHLNQFRRVHGRPPSAEELLDIILNRIALPGVPKGDLFEIEELARSIANNGVRKPPIIALDGTLLDGNRRLAACHYILNSDEFSSDQKQRAEYLFVWQLTEHATADDQNAVVVSLNFESDCKQPWPEYVKARKVYEEWQAMRAAEPRVPGSARVRQLKRELAQKFALGKDLTTVNRYIKMVEWADEFEEYLIDEKGKDEYEVKHRANEEFQYFDELSKGMKPGGVAYTLEQEPGYKHLVFDLLYEDKFRNWTLIRKLKYYDDDVRDMLLRAREEKDLEKAEELIETALTDAANRKREARVVGANARIETFVKWLEDLPLTSFQDPKEISRESLERLMRVLRLVESVLAGIPARGVEGGRTA